MSNGMGVDSSNDQDKEGFSFYPAHLLTTMGKEFENSELKNKDNIIIFANYQCECWWYGVEKRNEEEYVIGIIPCESTFKPITSSLAEFIEMYIADAPELYKYD